MFGTQKRVGWIAGVGAALLAVSACKPQEAVSATVDAGPVLVGPENLIEVKREQLQTGPRIAGSLEPERQARVRAELSGDVLSVAVDLGAQVKQGQQLARLEDQAVRDAYASARSQVTSAEQELLLAQRQVERTQRLAEAGAVAERDLETARSAAVSAQARVDQARAQLAAAQKQLDAALVKSPITGVVSERAVNAGDVVAPGAALFTIIDPSSMRLQASVPSDALPALAVGKPVRFQVRGYPGQTFEGKIQQIAPAADPVTRQITVLIAIPNPGGKLISGLFAEGRVAAESREALVVPSTGLEMNGEKGTAARVKDGKVERVDVKVGLRDPQTERVEVTGLEQGDLLLTGPARTLAAGTPVQVGKRP